ncbi:conserved hypothetical protein [Vibrio phage 150E35-1]|nr:conserved hypothetical protein [Vibrio phage 150E35-1]
MKLNPETTVQFICPPEWCDALTGSLIFLNEDNSLDTSRGYNMNLGNIVAEQGDNFMVEFFDGARHLIHGECLKTPNMEVFKLHKNESFWSAGRADKATRTTLDCGAIIGGASISATSSNPYVSVFVNCSQVVSGTHFEDLLDECEQVMGFRPMVIYGANHLEGSTLCEDHPAFA